VKMIAILKADARKIPLADESVQCVVTSPLSNPYSVECLAADPKALAVGNGARRMKPALAGHRRTPSATRNGRGLDSLGRFFVLPEKKSTGSLTPFHTEIREQQCTDMGGLQIARLIAVERPTIHGRGLLLVIPAAQRARKQTNGWLVHHANLNTLMVSRVHAPPQMFVRLRFLDANVGFPVCKSGEVSKNFVAFHLPTNTTMGGLSQYGGNRPC